MEYDPVSDDIDELKTALRELICKAAISSANRVTTLSASVPVTPPLGLILLTMMISVAGFFGIRKWKLK